MQVAIVVCDHVQALDVAGPLDVFAEANTFLSAKEKYRVSIVGSRAGLVSCSNGMRLIVPNAYADFDASIDLLLIAGGPQLPNATHEGEFLAWLRRKAGQAARFGSVCNGAFVLARAGLLDGKQVTTHWADARRLADEFPGANVQPDKSIVRDGRLFTSAGVTARIDLCLSLVAEDWGRELEVRLAKRLAVYTEREGGQAKYSPYFDARLSSDAIVGKVLQYVTEHIADTFSIKQLANAVSVSRRTLSRHFARYTDTTPSAFVEQIRVDAARKLLGDTNTPLKTVAFHCGFHSAAHMRATFSRRIKVTPRQYRQGYRETAAKPEKTVSGDRPASSSGNLHSPSDRMHGVVIEPRGV